MKTDTKGAQIIQTNVNDSTFSFFLGSTKITLEDKGESQGQITIYDQENGTYQMYWGAMGGNIQEFILRINSDYFADKLLGTRSTQAFDVKATFADLRRFIREELDLPWYKHMEFQIDLREKLSYFQQRCIDYNSEQYFVDHFYDYTEKRLNYYLILDRWERERIERDFKNISEPWNFIQTKESQQAKWLKSLHSKIKSKIK